MNKVVVFVIALISVVSTIVLSYYFFVKTSLLVIKDITNCYDTEMRSEASLSVGYNSICLYSYYGRFKLDCSLNSNGNYYHFILYSNSGNCKDVSVDLSSGFSMTCSVYYYDYNSNTYRYCKNIYISYPESNNCVDECKPREFEEYCVGNVIYKKSCGDFDSDSCFEWSKPVPVVDCSKKSGYYCEDNKIYYRDYYCSNYGSNLATCSYSQKFVEDCSSKTGWYCKDNNVREYRVYYCEPGDSSCRYRVTDSESCPAGYVCENGKCVAQGNVNIINWIINIFT